jgi:gamma-glutamyl-gamma-aminobutyrate hydrolase PuuD
MTARPRVGVTRWSDVPDEARDRYWSRVTEAGGEVVDIAEPVAEGAREVIPTLDALILTGGIDVDPSIYAQDRHVKVKEVDRARDEMELDYLRRALDADLPVLAICRGHQVLNVGFGGQLLQHIDSGEHRADFRTPGYPSRWHRLRIEPDTRLAGIFGVDIEINSRHHQAVTAGVLGAGLRPVAFADDHGGELIEGLESAHHRWVVGVQWHPERPEDDHAEFAPAMRRLYDALLHEIRSR